MKLSGQNNDFNSQLNNEFEELKVLSLQNNQQYSIDLKWLKKKFRNHIFTEVPVLKLSKNPLNWYRLKHNNQNINQLIRRFYNDKMKILFLKPFYIDSFNFTEDEFTQILKQDQFSIQPRNNAKINDDKNKLKIGKLEL
ncbi:hypothetical protein [Mycoplasmopsis sturni]|uniref:hypothetical protein n=1 Tax=Mycoplasmopsis sturni TaxID=39047 RepID=UPI00056CDFD7|nr:hypothetical protein [Mycoplasmopsis sturni]